MVQTNLRQRVFRSAFLSAGEHFAKNVLRFGSNLVLAYLLFPEAFALVALCSIVIQGMEMVTDVGIRPAVIRSERGNDPAFLNTAWTFQIARSLLLWGGACLLAAPMAAWYNQPELQILIPASAFSLVSTGFESMGIATASRRLERGTLTVWSLSETLLKTLITVVWAWVSPSVWALIGGSTITYIVSSISTHFLFRDIRHRFQWEPAAARELWGFGSWVSVSTLLTFLAQQIDKIILGKLFPIGVLGIYSISQNLSKLPLDIASSLMAWVLYPALAEIFRRDQAELGAKYAEARKIILAAGQFGTIGVMVCSPWFFGFLYDARYIDAARYTPALAIATWFGILHGNASAALVALGKVRSLAWSHAVKLTTTAAACLAGSSLWGMAGFIGGIGFGAFCGYLAVALTLRRQRIDTLKADLAYSVLVLGLALALVIVPQHLGLFSSHPLHSAAAGLAALAASALFAYRVLKPALVKARRKD